jgi:hypothetical protein
MALQTMDKLLVLILVKKVIDAVGDLRPDFMHLLQFRLRGPHQFLYGIEVFRE